jgi:hypothetical protein
MHFYHGLLWHLLGGSSPDLTGSTGQTEFIAGTRMVIELKDERMKAKGRR